MNPSFDHDHPWQSRLDIVDMAHNYLCPTFNIPVDKMKWGTLDNCNTAPNKLFKSIWTFGFTPEAKVQFLVSWFLQDPPDQHLYWFGHFCDYIDNYYSNQD